MQPNRVRAAALVGLVATLAAGAESAPASRTDRGGEDAPAAAAMDRLPPSKPRELRVLTRTETSITIAWTAARDDVRVAGYRLFRGGSLVAVRGPRARRHTFLQLRCDRRHTLAVSARDEAARRSGRRRIAVRTRPCAESPSPPPPIDPGPWSLPSTSPLSTPPPSTSPEPTPQDPMPPPAEPTPARPEPTPAPEPDPAPPPAGPTLPPASVFVTVGGSDAAACTHQAPCASFDRAYRVAAPGEIVEVAGGRYPSQTIHAKTGMAAPYVVFREAPGERVIVGDEGAREECLGFEGSQYVTLEGFETTYTTVGGMLHQCGVTIGRGNAHHVTLVDIDAGMIWVGADDVQVLGGDFGPGIDENTKIEWATGHEPRDVLIDGAVIHDQRSYLQHPECIALWGGTRVTIRNSRLYNCGTFHIFLVAYGDYAISDVLIENNTFTQPDASVHTSSTIKVGDKGGVLRNIVLRANRVFHDEVYVLQGLGEGGTGDVHLIDNEVTQPVELASDDDCMVDATYRPKPDVSYECEGNQLVVE